MRKLVVWWFFTGILKKKNYASWKNKLSEVVKTSFYESRRSIFSLKNFKDAQMCSFLVLTAKKSLRELVGRLVKSVFVLSTVKFWGKLFLWRFVFFSFWDFEWNKICLMAKEAQWSCQIIILRVQKFVFLGKT